MVIYLKGRDAPINDLEGDINVESDCEDDSTGVGDGTLKKEQEEESRAVLIAGSFSAYVYFISLPALRDITSYLAGSPFSSIAARAQSCLLPSSRKAQTLAWGTFEKMLWLPHPLPARRRAFTLWQPW